MWSWQGAGRVEQAHYTGSPGSFLRGRTGFPAGAARAQMNQGESMLEGKVALVTGASRGIGQAIALAMGKAGATVAGTATTEAGASAITEYLRAQNVAGAGYKLNVNDVAECEAT